MIKNRYMGVVFAGLSFFFFSSMDAFGKWLSTDYSFAQITFFSSVFSLLPIIFMLNGTPLKSVIKTNQYKYHLMRGVIILCMRFSALYAFSQMNFADSFSLILTGPIILLLLSPIILNEKITLLQIFCIILGFIGTLIVLRPGFVIFNWGYLGALGAALFFALNTIVMKKMGPQESPSAVLFYGMLFNIVASAALMSGDFIIPSIKDLVLLCLCGLSAGLAQLLIFKALQKTTTAVVGIMQYTCIVWAGILGFIIWNDIPDMFVVAGSSLIVLSGLFNIIKASGSKKGQKNTV